MSESSAAGPNVLGVTEIRSVAAKKSLWNNGIANTLVVSANPNKKRVLESLERG
jgi:hypothetical protein